uniref:Interleukin family protein n=1 Tax=Catharus ustulatus TaxID=91951 RepID=A0A8C3U3P4_CATUS
MVLFIVHFLNVHVVMRLKFWAKVHLQGVHLANHYLICFQTNCSVRDQLLSFYVKNVFSRLEVGSDKLYFISAFQVLQSNMDLPCAPSTRLTSAVRKLKRMFLKVRTGGIYKAIHELDILLPWIQAYIQTII